MPGILEEVRARLRDYLKTHSYTEAADEFGIDRAALHRFVTGKLTLKLTDRVIQMLIELGVVRE